MQGPQTQQLTINQATANSLLFDLSDSFMPLMIDSPSLAMQLIQLFPEMRLHYGPEVKLVLGFKLQED